MKPVIWRDETEDTTKKPDKIDEDDAFWAN